MFNVCYSHVSRPLSLGGGVLFFVLRAAQVAASYGFKRAVTVEELHLSWCVSVRVCVRAWVCGCVWCVREGGGAISTRVCVCVCILIH